jgi:hypothetical protein
MRRTTLIAATCALAALVPASSALAQGAPASSPGVPPGQTEFTRSTVQVTGSRAVPRFERSRQWLTAHSSHVITTTVKTGKVRFEGVTSPLRELRFDATSNELTVGKGSRTPPLNASTKKLLAFHAHPGAKRVAEGGKKARTRY